jgi:hypothetical protein
LQYNPSTSSAIKGPEIDDSNKPTTSSGLATWALWTIIGCSIAVVGALVAVTVVVVLKKKNQKLLEE